MTVTMPRSVGVEHVGGPYDGYVMPVDADENGNPPEYYTIDNCGPTDLSIDPGSGPVAQIATHFYDLESRISDDSIKWVYVHRGETYTEAAA